MSADKRRSEAAEAARERELDSLAREARLEALRRFTRRRMGLGMNRYLVSVNHATFTMFSTSYQEIRGRGGPYYRSLQDQGL